MGVIVWIGWYVLFIGCWTCVYTAFLHNEFSNDFVCLLGAATESQFCMVEKRDRDRDDQIRIKLPSLAIGGMRKLATDLSSLV